MASDKMEMDASEDEDIIMNNGNNKNNNTDNDEQIARRLQEEYYSLSHNNRSSNINGDITDNLPLNCISNIYNTKKSITQRHHNLSEATDSNNNSKFERFKKWIDYNLTCNYINWNDINNGLLSNEFIDQCFLDNEIQHIDIQYNQVKGWLFEYLCKFILIKKYKTPQVYLNNEIPHHLREQLNIPSSDKGIDIIFCDANNNNNNQFEKWIAVQCKYRSKHQNVHISKEYISDFIHELKLSNEFNHGIIMTNVENITPRFHDENIEWFLSIHLKEIINKQFLRWIISTTNRNTNSDRQRKIIKLRDYQKTAAKLLLESHIPRMQCIMPCGTGKTIVMFYYLLETIKAETQMKILFLFPSLQLINQIYQAFVEYFGTQYKTLCICSQMDKITLTQGEQTNDNNANDIFNDICSQMDKITITQGQRTNDNNANDIFNEFIQISDVPFTTDVNKINKFLSLKNNNNNVFVFSTYHSSKLLKGFNFNIAIYDE
eukprot:274700_1